MAFFRALSLLLMVASVLAAPTVNITMTTYQSSLGTATLGSEPRGRGTLGIIVTCTGTFFFCVWTAVHVNIMPEVKTSYRVFYKLMYMVVALIVPEGIIMCAFGQWREANKVHQAWRLKHGTHTDTLGMDGAYFVVMGGFVVDVTKEYMYSTANRETTHPTDTVPSTETPAPEAQDSSGSRTVKKTLTAEEFMRYMECDLIHGETFDKRAIVDKGKTSSIAKVLATFQILRLLAQCISRWKSNMPLTLLEIHVAIQVICTMIIYACWWSKPLDVYHPITIILRPATPTPHPTHSGEKLESSIEEGTLDEVRKRETMHSDVTILGTPRCLTAIAATAFYEMIVSMVETGEGAIINPFRSYNILAEGLFIFIIGALHAAAWNSHFPSNLECWLWRGSSIGMCVFPVATGLVLFTTNYYPDLCNIVKDQRHEDTGFFRTVWNCIKKVNGVCVKHAAGGRLLILHYLMMSGYFMLLLSYFFCVMFVTVEAYISLRSPPDGAFLTPVLSEAWHL